MESVPIITEVVRLIAIPLQGELNTTLCDKVCHGLAAGQYISPATPVSSIDKLAYC